MFFIILLQERELLRRSDDAESIDRVSAAFNLLVQQYCGWLVGWVRLNACIWGNCLGQVVTQYGDAQLEDVLRVCEKLEAHLTAAIVSNDNNFVHKVLGHTVNGTTYAGLRARTTGMSENDSFALQLSRTVSH